MARPRKISLCNLYHVTSRGVGGQIIFEDDDDRRHFLRLLKEACVAHDIKVAAWCLMDNHFHLLVMAPLEDITPAMKQVKERYAKDINRRHSRTGHLFQGTFSSFPIASESYLAAAIHYIHNNPVRAQIVEHPASYRWSSYQEYCGKRFLLDDSLMIDLSDKQDCTGFSKKTLYQGLRTTDNDAVEEAKRILGLDSPTTVKGLDMASRDASVKKLSDNGFTKAQIARLTGVSRSTVHRILSQ